MSVFSSAISSEVDAVHPHPQSSHPSSASGSCWCVWCCRARIYHCFRTPHRWHAETSGTALCHPLSRGHRSWSPRRAETQTKHHLHSTNELTEDYSFLSQSQMWDLNPFIAGLSSILNSQWICFQPYPCYLVVLSNKRLSSDDPAEECYVPHVGHNRELLLIYFLEAHFLGCQTLRWVRKQMHRLEMNMNTSRANKPQCGYFCAWSWLVWWI